MGQAGDQCAVGAVKREEIRVKSSGRGVGKVLGGYKKGVDKGGAGVYAEYTSAGAQGVRRILC